jgi:hypothetical protein
VLLFCASAPVRQHSGWRRTIRSTMKAPSKSTLDDILRTSLEGVPPQRQHQSAPCLLSHLVLTARTRFPHRCLASIVSHPIPAHTWHRHPPLTTWLTQLTMHHGSTLSATTCVARIWNRKRQYLQLSYLRVRELSETLIPKTLLSPDLANTYWQSFPASGSGSTLFKPEWVTNRGSTGGVKITRQPNSP